MIDRCRGAANVTLPRPVFAALCLQAMDKEAHLFIARVRIQELLTDPHNQKKAVLSIDTLNKLCRQAMSHSKA